MVGHRALVPEEFGVYYIESLALFAVTKELQWLVSPRTTTVVIQSMCLNSQINLLCLALDNNCRLCPVRTRTSASLHGKKNFLRVMGWIKKMMHHGIRAESSGSGLGEHFARATIDLLKDTLGDRLISRFGPVNWPPRSCDLTPLDYFLCGYVKSLVYADKPQTLDHLEDNIRHVIADIRPQMLEKVIENWTSRLDYIRASRGSHMPEIIFKM
ncbi:uncharacterized protein TNCV_4325291 [Trichonephila clavipes]|nr:uncharacterized protein TNCV_4325291 [Trichonephila clavipes]